MAVAPIPFEEIKLGERIGIGQYGRVYKAQWKGRTIAVKQISFGKADQQIEREVNQLAKLQHANIIILYGLSESGPTISLLMEYADGGSLSTLIHSSYPSYTLAHAYNWAHQIAQALAYLHEMKPKPIIHRDIKPNNAVLSQKGLSLKICDFGTVVDLKTSMTKNVGTCLYKAPEIFNGDRYSEKCDVHSWAITFWEILARKQPFEQCKTPSSVMFAVNGGTRPLFNDNIKLRDCPEDLIILTKACWDPEPSKRFSMKLVANSLNQALTNAGPLEPLKYNIIIRDNKACIEEEK